MNREYVRWYSPALQKNMELLVFGSGGTSVLFFPARQGRFYDYENWGIIESLLPKIEKGYIKVFCVDSVDAESFYNFGCHPSQKIKRHIQYEQYIKNEVMPFVWWKNYGAFTIAAGCSLGAYHAINIALKNPRLFNKVVAMSGRYDLTKQVGYYRDLMEGYWDENTYFSMPMQFMANLTDPGILHEIRKIELVLAVGREDVLLQNNMQLSRILSDKGIKTNLHIWDYEAHRAKSWKQMVQIYL